MPSDIRREDVQRLIEHDAQVVEVLPRAEYKRSHLPGAASMPLAHLDHAALKELDRDRPVVVYCWDSACDLSPRAARRLETLGFREVYDYVEGKLDWIASGLPFEGDETEDTTAGDLAHRVPTCALDDKVGDVQGRLRSGETSVCVVDAQGVVLGLLELDDVVDPASTAADVMKPGPVTYRPFVPPNEILEQMCDRDLDRVLVTTSDGVLIGELTLSDVRGPRSVAPRSTVSQ